MSHTDFPSIAETQLNLHGPAERIVTVRVGQPVFDPEHPPYYRCPFQILGLSNDNVQFAPGVDSFHSLNIALSGVRRELRTNTEVLAAFHKDFALTQFEAPWEAVIPVWVQVESKEESEQLEVFVQNLWKQRLAAKRAKSSQGHDSSV